VEIDILTLLIQLQYTQYSRLLTKWTTPDNAIMHFQIRSGVIIWQRVLKQQVNISNIHG